ncbi:TetR/AcrR family transcriptional regulator [Parendozoicomonas haliclonae]|uniref:Division inhibitor protein n=1 Tax=Parendozoicomonas haliclonae TaxID=1960125 RepID=A0A1X7AN98_9GAMM|nr:TetR/AcrR family transcriptional regulator [Parendozoicomonas haliclonae]SMA49541.1 division inhibitor protein [Parendozoicomonas haliclonae]
MLKEEIPPNAETHQRYHHGNLRAALLCAAFKQLDNVGPDKISMRAIARDVGVSQTAPYRHFPNKDLLLVALAVEGFKRLEQRIRQRSADHPDAFEALMAGSEDYLDFAREKPELYRLMFGPALAEWRKPEFMHGVPPAAFAALVEVVEKAINQGSLNNSFPAWFMAKSCWAQIHGHAMMMIDDILDKGIPQGASFDIKASLRLCMDGMKAKPVD